MEAKEKTRTISLRRVNKEECMPTPKYKGRSLKHWWKRAREMNDLISE